MTKDELIELAQVGIGIHSPNAPEYIVCEALIEALAQPEPVVWEQFYPDMGKPKLAYLSPTESPDNACYIPPQRTWVGLTKEEFIYFSSCCHSEIVDEIEKLLQRKNT